MSATLTQVYVFRCDEPGCDSKSRVPGESGQVAARLHLQRFGWQMVATPALGLRDFCPEHLKNLDDLEVGS